MKIRYIATCRKTDSIAGCGITWEQGDIKDVTPKLAEKLLEFPDTWEEIHGDTLGKGATGKNAAKEPVVLEADLIDLTPQTEGANVLPVVNFNIMDKESVVEYIRRNYNEDVDPKKTLQEMRQDAQEIFIRRENDLLDEEEEKKRVAEAAEAKADAELKAEADAKAEAEAKALEESNAKVKAQLEAKAKAKAEKEAKAKAEEDADIKEV